jgi:hypothetical protein
MSNELTTTRAADMSGLAASGEHAVKTGMLPDHIKTGWQFAVIAAAGHEMGMQPMRAIRSLAMVKGKVVEAADSQLARFKTAGGRSEFETLDDQRAVLHLVHPNGDKHTETFTREDAKRAGLDSNANYQKFPRAMLRSRAITAGLKSIGWEGAVGAYDPEELPAESPAPASAPIEYRPRGGKPPKLVTAERLEELAIAPKPPAPSGGDAFVAAIAAAQTAPNLDECDAIRRKLEATKKAGRVTDAEYKDVVQALNDRANQLIIQTEGGADG